MSSDPAARLAEIRGEIDRIDSELLKLLEERTNFALEAGAAKAALGRPVHDPEREAQLLARISARAPSLRAKISASRPTAPRPCTCCALKRGSSSSGRIPMAQ